MNYYQSEKCLKEELNVENKKKAPAKTSACL
jgi:hypothetical protein